MRQEMTTILTDVMARLDALPNGGVSAHSELRSFWTTGSTTALIFLKNYLGVSQGLREVVQSTYAGLGLDPEVRFRLEMDVYDIWSDTFDRIPFEYRHHTLRVLLSMADGEPVVEEPQAKVFSLFGRKPRDNKAKERSAHNARMIREYRLKR